MNSCSKMFARALPKCERFGTAKIENWDRVRMRQNSKFIGDGSGYGSIFVAILPLEPQAPLLNMPK